MTLRLLITARDAAAALHLIQVARAAAESADITLDVAAQNPAATYFKSAGITHRYIDLAPVREPAGAAADAMRAAAAGVLAEVRPHVVLSGLTTPGDGGIDEAVVGSFAGPTVTLQDFWGEVNAFFGKAADLHLALDDEGVRLTRARHGLAAVAIGSPRHSAYADLDITAIRKDLRSRLRGPVIGFFGQALHAIEGYRRTVRAWAEAILRQPGGASAVYRPHPRETAAEADWTTGLLAGIGIECTVLDACPVEHALLACDVVCSAFSNCTYDVAYLNRFSAAPVATPLALFFDPEVVAYFRRMVRLDEFPYLKAGLVLPVREGEQLADLIAEAAGAEAKSRYWHAAQALADPRAAPERALAEVRRMVGRARAAC
jgi:hypothetical protein